MSRTLHIASEAETLQADLYGDMVTPRVVVLVHGSGWDASGGREIAPRFLARGVAALALNLRGYDGSTGTSRWEESGAWSPVVDLAATKAMLRKAGAREIALVGASMGGHAVLASSFDEDVECVVSISAPAQETPDELSARVRGRKLFVCANEDTLGAAPHVLRAFAAADAPKTLLMFGGKEHSRGMFAAPYGEEAISAIVDFVARGE
ncbi:MAG TPA: alpha/beta fold hydrolase [Candidatus Limnocylindria bacterium]|nr:alpha/beta fold hydrolase [Candidatus Limnocylindria bacterium]